MSETDHLAKAPTGNRFVGKTDDAIVIVDNRGKIVCASLSAESLLRGAKDAPTDLIGLALSDLVSSDEEDVGAGARLTGNATNGPGVSFEHLGTLSLPSISGDARVLRLRFASDDLPIAGRQADTVAVVAHEVKTPLTAIIGSLTLIDAGAVGTVAAEMKPLVEMALRNARRVHTMINDLLDVETIPDDRMPLQPTDLAEIVRRSVDAFSGVATAKGVVFRVRTGDQPIEVRGSAERLERAVENLLSNATKFSDQGGTVKVSVDSNTDWTRVTVADTGPGIPPSFEPMIFEKFAKHDVEDGRNREGTGLGLSIAKAIVEAHSGRIGFTSRPGDTRFWIDIPTSAEMGSDE